jgi:beta-lactam-binding protein with PASTA domain/serine/threonine protein kinase
VSEENLVLSGRYALGTALGHGGMADVYLAQDTRLHRTVAVKVLRTELARDPSFQERFRREAQSAAGLNHPNIVAVYDTGEETTKDFTGHEISLPYIVMEYVRGRTLREFIDPEQPMDMRRASEIMIPLLSALEYSHQAGIVHRDIKPGNVMITDDGDVKVMDFGIARAMSDATGITQTQAVMGTAQYLSPEQARGQLVDARSDIYSAACVLYEMLTGRPPFTGDSPVSIAYQHVRETPPAPSAYNATIPPNLDAVILTGLAKDRDTRYPTALAFSQDLDRVRSGRPPLLTAAATEVLADADATTVLASAGDDDDRTQALPITAPTPVVAASTSQDWTTGPNAAVGPTGAAVGSSDGEVTEPKKKRPVWLIVLILVLVAAVVAALLIVFKPWQGASFTKVEVPDVVGQTQQEAKSALTDEDLKPTFKEKASSEVDEGSVISTDPTAGQKVDRGSEVTVAVSSGPKPVDVPDLVGKSKKDAQDALEDVGLGMEVAGEEDVAKRKADEVTRTQPSKGDTARAGDDVKVWVATGNVSVPDLTGTQQDEASDTLEGLGLKVTVTTKEDDDEDPGTVLEQSPPGGEKAKVGTEVTLVVAEEPGPFALPNVEGQSLEDAQKTLSDKGLGTKVEHEYSDSVDEGHVIRTDPKAKKEVTKGDTITIVVSDGPEPAPSPTTEPTDEPTDEPSDDPSEPSDGGGDEDGDE